MPWGVRVKVPRVRGMYMACLSSLYARCKLVLKEVYDARYVVIRMYMGMTRLDWNCKGGVMFYDEERMYTHSCSRYNLIDPAIIKVVCKVMI